MDGETARNATEMPFSSNNETAPTASVFVPRTEPETIVFVMIYAILSALIIFVNFLVIFAYRRNPKLQTATNLFFINLAISDFVVGAVSIPLWMYSLLCQYTGAFPNKTFKLVYYFFDIFSALASISFLTVISAERNTAISKPLYHRTLPLRKYYRIVWAIWLYAMILAATFIQEFGPGWLHYRGIVSFLTGFFVPLCLIIVMYINICRNVRKCNFRRRSLSSNTSSKDLQRERRTTYTVAIVIGLFVVAWLPFFTLSILSVFCGHTCIPMGASFRPGIDLVKMLHYSNSVVNPFVYGYRNAKMRRTILNILVRCTRFRRACTTDCRVLRVPQQSYVIAQARGIANELCQLETPL